MVQRYIKKPVPVEAMQYDGAANLRPLLEWGAPVEPAGEWSSDHNLRVVTLEGKMLCRPGDYIIKGVRGEFYPCARDIFEETYEPMSHVPANVIHEDVN